MSDRTAPPPPAPSSGRAVPRPAASAPGAGSWAPAASPVVPAVVLRAATVLAVGLTIGVLTSLGQTVLGTPLSALVNSASAWLVAPYLVGRSAPSIRTGAALGFVVCAAQLVGYDVASVLRGFGAGGAQNVFWGACAVVGGPVFGAAGALRRTGAPGLRGIGSTVLPAAFLAEGAWVYGHELQYWSTLALWAVIGLVLLVVGSRGTIERRWIGLTLPVALLGELALTATYTRAF
ncbi:DUF6518 family protein [Patulibacter sp.]|uniref:DUF6518 family protein n=1 Tax=Patulibacter sp. TaxID=1912859 RepID=UPI00271DA11D|nr:DUF6518 family protein [Patulibacter sp.]MDO9407019.1 DUF6518 family protein [Patulibacter sp.]